MDVEIFPSLPVNNRSTASDCDALISQLYRATATIPLIDFPHWSLEALRRYLPFDGALWCTGHTSTMKTYNQTTLDVSENLSRDLLSGMVRNPILSELLVRRGEPVDMSDVVCDEEFYQSDIYRLVFSQHGIERILSSVHIDVRSGLFTVLTLYRYEREHLFTQGEKDFQKRVLFHLLTSASHASFIQLENAQRQTGFTYALCDESGIYHQAQSGFLDLIDHYVGTSAHRRLPFDLPLQDTTYFNLYVTQEPVGELLLIGIRPAQPLDQLTEREKEVVEGITHGLSFKVIARELQLSTSTVANHLYRVYHKLGINSRTELAQLASSIELPKHHKQKYQCL